MGNDLASTIDVDVEQLIGGVHEILAILRSLEPDDRAAEKPPEELSAPRADRVVTWMRPGDMPERDNGAEWQALANGPGRERKVIVLNQNQRPTAVDLLRDGLGKSRVDRLVCLEVIGSKNRLDVSAMTERPQALVRKTLVIPSLLS